MSPCSFKSYFLLYFLRKQNRHETIFDMQIKNKRCTELIILRSKSPHYCTSKSHPIIEMFNILYLVCLFVCLKTEKSLY